MVFLNNFGGHGVLAIAYQKEVQGEIRKGGPRARPSIPGERKSHSPFCQNAFLLFARDGSARTNPNPDLALVSDRGEIGWQNLYDGHIFSSFRCEALNVHCRQWLNVACRPYASKGLKELIRNLESGRDPLVVHPNE